MLKLIGILVVVIAAIAVYSPDVLSGMDSNHDYSNLELQMVVSAFCFSPIVGVLNSRTTVNPETTTGDFTFTDHGEVENEDYAQSSIYAILYAMYKNANLTSPHGVKYQFTFNTWGFAPSPYPEEDPERFGKAAYAGLVTQPPALEYKKALGKPLKIVEIGCGTGAGANLITREVHPDAEYLALDMQQAAINTCNTRHATADNPGLKCQVVPNGVGNANPKAGEGETNKVPGVEDSSVDFVVISETHIADVVIGDLEKAIFAEIVRILKPGGLFLWGNALPTRVWNQADKVLPTMGFELVSNINHTAGAVTARDDDAPRVDMAIAQLIGQFPVMKLPYFGERCTKVTDRLIANFYRHPGTAMYLKMVSGFDSYMHQAWKLKK